MMADFSEDDFIELSLLRGFEVDDLVSLGLLPEDRRFDDSALQSLDFSYPEMKLEVITGASYPADQLSFQVENLTLSRVVFDSLRIQLRIILADDAAVNNYRNWKEREYGGVFEFEKTALHLVQKTVEYLNSLQAPGKADAVAAKYKNDYIPNSGLSLSLIKPDASASKILSKSPEEICAKIPPCFRVLHVESVLRNDTYSDFVKCQERMKERIEKTVPTEHLRKAVYHSHLRGNRDSMIQHLVTPKLTFHGTSNHLVPSIVRYGFLRPGDFNPETESFLIKRCGGTYGRGVYSSPSAEFSLMYSGEDAQPTKPNGFWGLKLIVCATIMGVSRKMFVGDNWRAQNQPYPGFDSHVANNELEYIVFDCAQILPCYVIHLDWGEDNRYYFDDIPEDPQQWTPRKHPKLEQEVLAPGDKQRAKEALFAKAAKYFPYGYGPSTGTRFVVEDVAEVDEDDEEYGDYQKDRIDGVDDSAGKSFWEWDLNLLKRDENDEYTEALWGKRKQFKNTVESEE